MTIDLSVAQRARASRLPSSRGLVAVIRHRPPLNGRKSPRRGTLIGCGATPNACGVSRA